MMHMQQRQRRYSFLSLQLFIFALMLIAALLPALGSPANARDSSGSSFDIAARTDGVTIGWRGTVEYSPDRLPVVADWPQVAIGGWQLPARLVTMQATDSAPLIPHIDHLESQTWLGALAPVETTVPQTIAGDRYPDLATPASRNLPDSPITILRDSYLRGTRLVVIAISPMFARDGEIRAATNARAFIPNAILLDEATGALPTTASRLANAPTPDNPAASVNAARIRVTQAGIQTISGSDLTAAGLDLDNAARFQLWFNGEKAAIETRGSGASFELRFYAPEPDDRWNAYDTYWLTTETSAGLRMTTRSVAPGTAQTRSTALEYGIWHNSQFYDTTVPGADGDHWYSLDMRTGPSQPPTTATLTLTPTLPLGSGTTVLTATGAARADTRHHLDITLDGVTRSAVWDGVGNWTQIYTFTTNGAEVRVVLQPGSEADFIYIDAITWERPVRLNFAQKGAMFAGVAGVWRYQLSNLPADATLYDVSNLQQPVILRDFTTAFEDGPTPHRYVLAEPGTLHTPEVTAHQPATPPSNADVLYIAPEAFHSALAPLIALRQSQGYTPAIVDVQDLYDLWSFGQVDPEAIRSFLRYASATWSKQPTAVTLVGDGTTDPLDYTGRNNTNFIPPYLAMVDPWLGETACETCYARLDGDDPLEDALPDLAIGRLPVKSVNELETVVAKIVNYAATAQGIDWRSRIIYIADNGYEADGAPDEAGDFAALSEQSILLQPPGIEIVRLYYDPWKHDTQGNVLNEPWREADAQLARQSTIAVIDAGAGLVNYTGHSNSWQWATTDISLREAYLLGLYDIDFLSNGQKLPVVLAMTCLTSSFQRPAYSGSSLDERWLLHANGGAIAVWGSTGLGVTHGHKSLQRGFYQALWAAPPRTATLGTLVQAGYQELFTNGNCCEDALRTFALLGDPLTIPQVQAANRIYLPIIAR